MAKASLGLLCLMAGLLATTPSLADTPVSLKRGLNVIAVPDPPPGFDAAALQQLLGARFVARARANSDAGEFDVYLPGSGTPTWPIRPAEGYLVSVAQAADVAIPSGSGWIEGIARADGYADLTGIRVTLPGTQYSASCDTGGRFRLAVPAGRYTALLSGQGMAPVSLPSLVVTAQQTAALGVVTLGPEPVPTVSMSLNGGQPTTRTTHVTVAWCSSGAVGVRLYGSSQLCRPFQLSDPCVPNGRKTLTLPVRGSRYGVSAEARSASGLLVVTHGSVELIADGSIDGLLLDGTSQPISATAVSISDPDPNPSPACYTIGPSANTTQTTVDGSFSFQHVRLGTWQLTAASVSAITTVTITRDGETVSATLRGR
ncbi:MAG: hypothetical protein HY816_20190 [Candidatus Wallbacteria bacterium]|nr:hypothetical protein [Candidatus Wallbacteria bacterium]